MASWVRRIKQSIEQGNNIEVLNYYFNFELEILRTFLNIMPDNQIDWIIYFEFDTEA